MNEPREPDGLTHVTVRQARQNLADLLNRAAYGVERIVILRRGTPIAAIVCVEDLEHLEAEDSALDAKMLRSLRPRARKKPRAAHGASRTAERRA